MPSEFFSGRTLDGIFHALLAVTAELEVGLIAAFGPGRL